MTYAELIEILPKLDKERGEEIIIHYMCQKDETIPNMLKLVQSRQELDKEIRSELNVNLSFLAFAIQQKDENVIKFRMEESKRFYTEYQDYIKTTGVHVWPDLK